MPIQTFRRNLILGTGMAVTAVATAGCGEPEDIEEDPEQDEEF